ncbi:hypothetical protein AB8O64_19840 [Streptomyces sp. QH1-20]|uniref:hypothetical protein n=1 Tax=Streptomyces sp. QH1-20 TaxID=3240934 RepID=UPI0035195AD6
MSRRARAVDRELARARRREILAVLLSRAERLLPAEAELLRAMVDTEIADGDQARRSLGGQSAAVRRLQNRVEAAEQAIVEAEADARRAEQALADREPLALMPVQSCRICGAGYTLGRPCPTCAYRARAAGLTPEQEHHR